MKEKINRLSLADSWSPQQPLQDLT